MGFAMANDEVGLPAMVNCILTGQIINSQAWQFSLRQLKGCGKEAERKMIANEHPNVLHLQSHSIHEVRHSD